MSTKNIHGGHLVELWVAMNEHGDWVVVTEESDALNELAAERGGSVARLIKVSLDMTAPTIDEVNVTVADKVGTRTAINID